MFPSLLIANRGEIACRIIRTARRLKIKTVAVYSDADRNALHVEMAGDAVRIGPASPRESYLNIEAIVAAAKKAKAAAIHPGYGFLSEKPEFAEACARAGIVFVGPPASAIRAMGLKDEAKRIMAKAGVPVVPGYLGDDQSPKRLLAEARKIGWPVLIKAVAGGGGKGMRRVNAEDEFAAALASAMREAKSAFGDDRVLIEKYLARPRHIEIQVFADTHGNAVHLFERDCSLQRRHQKVIEEAPAPGMTASLRKQMGEAAVKAAKAIGYVGAGTVEFIADASDGLKPGGFYFMEMNTRLQVEHPVTEMIAGLDLVEWQLRVAAGEKLPRAKVAMNGHAVEARLYAEDPAKGFLPSTGTLARLRFPRASKPLRIDAGVREGDEITIHYDPMIAKIVAHAGTRKAALERLANALDGTEIAGVKTNAHFLAACLRHPRFVKGDVDTHFIDEHLGELARKSSSVPNDIRALAALYIVLERRRRAEILAAKRRDKFNPWNVWDGFRIGHRVQEAVEFVEEGAVIATSVTMAGTLGDEGELTAKIGGKTVKASAARKNNEVIVSAGGKTYVLALYDPLAVGDVGEATSGGIAAPMPGKVVQVMVRPGDRVTRGQALVILEAMKMEHTLAAPADATVESVSAKAGEQVAEGTILVSFAQG